MAFALASAAAAAACDIKETQHVQRTVGPAITVLATNVEGTSAVIPANGVIQISFDRYLLPATITRQSYAVRRASGEIVENTVSSYDPVARVVTIGGEGSWLEPNQPYKLVLPVATDPSSNLGGYRAIDRAALAEARTYSFFAGPPRDEPYAEPTADFCSDVFPIFAQKCAGACHVGTGARASLLLDSAEGIRLTAIDRLAQGANTSASAVSRQDETTMFGINMAVIQPGDPGSSWLMYKIEIAPPTVIDPGRVPEFACDGIVAVATAVLKPQVPVYAADPLEQAVLNDYVLGREMPYPALPGAYRIDQPKCSNPTPSAYALTPLTFAERERVRLWIGQGAAVRDCGACAEVIPPLSAYDYTLSTGERCGGQDGGSIPDAGTD